MKIAPRIAVDHAFAAQRQRVDRAQNTPQTQTQTQAQTPARAAAPDAADIVDFVKTVRAASPDTPAGPIDAVLEDNPTLLSLALQSDPQSLRAVGGSAGKKTRDTVAVGVEGAETDLLHVALSSMLSAHKAFY